jgi:peptidyl-prolyl cis-trans isomerase SurA
MKIIAKLFKLSLTASLLFCFFAFSPVGFVPVGFFPIAKAETITLDRVVAVVDDNVVMESELQDQLRTIVQRMSQQNGELPPENILKQQVLEHLIVQQLQLQVAKRVGIEIDEQEVNEAILQMQQANNVTPEQFVQQLALEGLTVEELRQSVRQEIVIQRVQRGVLNSRIKITDHDVDSFLNSKEGQFWNSPEMLIGHILIPVASSASDSAVSAAEEEVRSLRQKVVDGADFRQLATAYSAGQNALQGGDLGWSKAAELPALFAENLDGLKTGEVTQPFRSGAGFHLLTIHEQRGATQAVIEQSKVRHILLKPSAILSDEAAKNKLLTLREQALEKNNFAELAKANSEDIGSMLGGGDLGWSLPGQFVPEFEAVMQGTDVGDISHPFRSEFGWHIIYIEDRRSQDMSEEVKRNQARGLLRNRRFEEELPLWLQEIRNEAFVDIKIAELADLGESD